jgi:phospholipid transport system substrate-binding protein
MLPFLPVGRVTMRYVGGLAAALGLIAVCSASFAASAPRTTIEGFYARALGIVTTATSAAQARDDMRDLVRGLFDGRRAAQQALGREWEGRAPAEQEEFARLFTNAVERTWLAMVRGRIPRNRPPELHIVDEQIGDGGAALVRTRLTSRDHDDLLVDYVMAKSGTTWRIHDVVIDGVSLVENFRAQFARVLRTSSYDELASRLRALDAADVAPPRPALAVAYFDTGRAELRPGARQDLASEDERFRAAPAARAVVESHADQRGDSRANQRLAQRRADAVRRQLVALGVADDRIVTVVHGDQQPVCAEPVESCWEQNRRVIVRLTP